MSCRTRQPSQIYGPNRQSFETVLVVARLSPSRILVRSLNSTPPNDPNDPDDIGDCDQAGDQPQQRADGWV